MSNLAAAVSQAALMVPSQEIKPKQRSKHQVAKRVFQLAAGGGFPYESRTYKDWAQKWLTSDTFKLMEIEINAAASINLPKNPERVAYRLLCAADSVDPIVVDVNRHGRGMTRLGYVPKVCCFDGKHRKQAMMLQGHARILAWVGCKAEKYLHNTRVVNDIDFRNVHPIVPPREEFKSSTPLRTAYNLHCAVVPSVGQPLLDQSGGEAGTRPEKSAVRPTSAVRGATAKKCPHCGSSQYKLMPTDFETAKCSKCGRNFQAAAGGMGEA